MEVGTGVAILASIFGIGSVIAACLLYIIRSEMKSDVTRLDGRINTHENGCEKRQQGIDARLARIEHYNERMDQKLDRIVEAR